MLNLRKLCTLFLVFAFSSAGSVLAQGHGGPGGGHGGNHDGPGGGHGGMHPDSLIFVDLSGTVMIDSIAWGFHDDSTGGCHEWDSTFVGGGQEGNHQHGTSHHETDYMEASHNTVDHEILHENDSLRAVYFLDTDADGMEDYVLNFGPPWFQPADSTLMLPEAGAEITITGALMENAPMWDMDVVVVTMLNGAVWRELGPMQGGGMMPRRVVGSSIGHHENSPNPFNPSTDISIELLQDGNLDVSIYDITGHQIKNLVNQGYTKGNYNFTWDGKNYLGNSVPSGVYFYRIQTGNSVSSSRITLLK